MQHKEFKIKELVEKNYEIVDMQTTIFKVLGIFKTKENVKAVLVFEDNKYRGIITEEYLIRLKFDPTEKVTTVMKFVNPLDSESTTTDAAKKMIENGLRAIPVSENNRIIGIVSAQTILSKLKETEFGDLLVSDLMTEYAITLKPNDKISKAITLMRKKHVSRIPIVDDENKVIGIVTVRDIVEKVIYPRERAKFGDLAGEIYTPLSAPVSAIMSTNVHCLKKDDKIKKFIELVEKYDISGSPVIDEKGRIVGIITIKDLLEELAKQTSEEVTIFINTAGVPLDEIDRALIERIIKERIVRKYKKVFGNYVNFYIYIKKIRETVERSNIMKFFNVRIRVLSEHGRYYASDEGWDLYNAIRNAFDALEEQLRRDKSKIDEKEVYREIIEEAEIL